MSTSAEQRLVFLASQLSLSNERLAQIRGFLNYNLDWQKVIQISLRHSTLPLVFINMKRYFPTDLPSTIYQKLEQIFILNAVQAVRKEHQIKGLVEIFTKNNIPLIVYKGPVLAKQVYGNISYRSFVDVDLLIKPEDIEKGYQLLISLGFCCPIMPGSARFKKFFHYGHHLQFYRPADKMLVELHWEIVQRNRAATIDTDAFFSRMQMLDMGGWMCPVLNPQDHFLVLISHGAKHLWSQLKWICDVHQLLLAFPGWDWNQLFETVKAKGLWIRTASALQLVCTLFEHSLIPQIKVNWTINTLTNYYLSCLHDDESLLNQRKIIKNALISLLSLDNWYDRMSLVYYKLTPRV